MLQAPFVADMIATFADVEVDKLSEHGQVQVKSTLEYLGARREEVLLAVHIEMVMKCLVRDLFATLSVIFRIRI